jgi:hypothetical protein
MTAIARGYRRRGPGRRCGRSRTSGQALVETIIALTIVMLIVVGLIQLSMLASVRHMLNFAAFSAARGSVYGPLPNQFNDDSLVRAVTDPLPRGTHLVLSRPERDVYRVTVDAPFGYPLSGTPGRTLVSSVAPLYAQRDIREKGDNAK